MAERVAPVTRDAAAPARASLGPSWRWLAGAAGALVAALLAGLAMGPAGIPADAIVSDVASRLPFLDAGTRLENLQATVLWEIRAPRVALGALVGGMLALAGGSYQAVFHNPLADPYLLGVAAGAGLGATVAIAYAGAGTSLLPVAAFAGAVLAVAAAYALGRSVGITNRAALVLAGVAVAAFLTAIQTFVLQQNAETVRSVYAWLLGRLSTSGWGDVLMVLPYIALSAVTILAYRRVLDVLRVGDEEAATLGVAVTRVRLLVVIAATLGTAAAVSVSGLIGFVGILVPHAVRLLAGGAYRVVLPLSAMFGAVFLVVADIAARTVLSPAELPIGVVTACIGAPFFAVVLRTTRTVAP
ncbi:MAG: iron chelate uptake ABC transporter family permease subunit [Propionibacteriales bacterium]|nr:iron chelate uptake ABC transporter family permease subunit [Propionibacteriales bacterium]